MGPAVNSPHFFCLCRQQTLTSHLGHQPSVPFASCQLPVNSLPDWSEGPTAAVLKLIYKVFNEKTLPPPFYLAFIKSLFGSFLL